MKASRLTTALALVGALALLLLGVAAVLGTLAVRRGFSARDEPSAVEAWAARRMRDLAVPARVKSLQNPLPPSPEVLADARAHWADHCAVCHAADGSGQTPIGQGLFPRAPDMRASATQRQTDGELYAIIQDGVRLTGMPAWGRAGDEQDAGSWALVHLIRRLPTLTPDEVRAIEALMPVSQHAAQETAAEDDFLSEEEEGAPAPAPADSAHPSPSRPSPKVDAP